MKKIDNLIMDAIDTLLERGAIKGHIIIAYSSLVKRYIEACIQEEGGLNRGQNRFYCGVELYTHHPYNEIVIYDKDWVSYNPSLMVKIEFTSNVHEEGNKIYNPLLEKFSFKLKQ